MRIDTIGGRRTLFVMATTQEYGDALKARIDPLVTGVGVVEAAVALTRALAELDQLPERVVSLGSAGSCCKPVGEVFQVSEVSWRDIDAFPLGFPAGTTPFLDEDPVQRLETPLDWPTATLSTGSQIVSGDGYDRVATDLVDMESWAVLRACRQFEVPLVGLRGVSDGAKPLTGIHDWTELLHEIDTELARALDALAASWHARPNIIHSRQSG